MRVIKGLPIIMLAISLGLAGISCDKIKKETSSSSSGGSSPSGGGGTAPATVPSAPTLDTVKCFSSGGKWNLTGTWASVSGATSYNIYYLIAPGSKPSSDVVKNTGTKITGVLSGYAYAFNPSYHSNYYVVTAVNTAGESAASNAVYATCGG